MRKVISILSLIILWPLGGSWAQLVSPNQSGVAFGHLHYHVRDIEANKKFWMALGAQPAKLGQSVVMKFPGFLILLSRADSSGGYEGSVLDHVGFRVQNANDVREKITATGFKVQTSPAGGGGSVFTPEGERLELFQGLTENVRFILDGGRSDVEADRNNRELTIPLALHHIHFYIPESDVAKIKTWYVQMFGAIPGHRFHYDAADLPGVNLNFLGVPKALAPTKGRVLDHIGFEIKNLQAFCKKLEARGVKFDEPFKKQPSGVATAYLTDPWGTYIELTEGLDRL